MLDLVLFGDMVTQTPIAYIVLALWINSRLHFPELLIWALSSA